MTRTEKVTAEVVRLVDDARAVLKSIGRLLASDGLSMRPFTRSQAFLAYVQANFVPVVMLDIDQ